MNSNQPKGKPFKIKETTVREYTGGDVSDSNADSIIKAAYGAKLGNEPSISTKYAKPQGVPVPAHMQAGGRMQRLQDGGIAEGPSHEEGGIEVQQEDTGEPVAEIEGGERIFSVEDTDMIEQAAMAIIQSVQSGDEESAKDMAMRLGFSIVQMIAAQEQSQEKQEQEMGEEMQPEGREAEAAVAANEFAQEPDNMETI